MKVRRVSYGRHRIRVLAIDDLIHMKEESNRPQDRSDAAALHKIRQRSST